MHIVNYFVMLSVAQFSTALSFSSWGMIGTGCATIAALFFISAPYGRYSPNKDSGSDLMPIFSIWHYLSICIGWGILISPKLAWFLMESPNLWMSILIFTLSISACVDCTIDRAAMLRNPELRPNIILISCFMLHYIHRSIIYPIRMQTGNKMPLSVMLLAFTFCCWNGFNQATSILIVSEYPSSWIYSTQFIIGICLFALGMYINITADGHLLALKAQRSGSSGYSIPRGGLFDYISCPNYCKNNDDQSMPPVIIVPVEP